MLIGGRGIGLGTSLRETHVRGNVEKITSPAAGSIQNGTAGAKLVFDGVDPQIIDGISGDFTGISGIPSIELDNNMGLTITNGNIDIFENLILTDGNIFTSAGNILRLTEDAAQVNPVGGQPNSFVDGPMQWTLSNSAAERKFPVGNNDRYRPLSISNRRCCTNLGSAIYGYFSADYTCAIYVTEPYKCACNRNRKCTGILEG